MSLKQQEPPVISIFPLSFLQIAQSSDAVVRALQEKDVQAQRWFASSQLLQRFMTVTGVPLYYHWFTSGYGAFIDNQIVGWLFLRGWRQVLYIEGLAVSNKWRRRGVGTALMYFAEQQAQELRRDWLGLTVTVKNNTAVSLYERHGFQRGYTHILYYEGDLAPAIPSSDAVLSPIVAQTAGQWFQHFAERDLAAGNANTAQVQSRFLGREPYRSQIGRHWLVRIGGKPVAYLHRHGSPQRLVLYLAALPEFWANSQVIGALAQAVGKISSFPVKLDLRLASSGHHEAMCAAMIPYGFTERPAMTMKMFKHLV